MTMTELCPSCMGQHLADDPDHLVQYDHTSTCELATRERETLAEDVARHRKYGTAIRHRPSSTAERELLSASGVRGVDSGELFTRVEWCGPDLRLRSWSRAGIVAADLVPVR